MKKHIYADNAATTQLDLDAFESMKPWLLENYSNASQPYSFSREAKKAIAESRALIAKCINASPEEIYFTSGGTESNNWVIKSSVINKLNKNGIVTSSIEHNSILKSCETIKKFGYPVSYMCPTKEGTIKEDILESHITKSTLLVSVMLVNNEIGSIQPIKKLCYLTHCESALFHTDAVQAIGHMKVDVQELGVDMLSASAHKFNGPKGIGFLYIRNGIMLQPYVDGGAQEKGFRAGTENVAAIVGMSTACMKNCMSIKENQQQISNLESHFFKLLFDYKIPYVRNGSSNTIPGLISISFPEVDSETILHRMDLMGISVSTGAACDSKSTIVSHVLKAIKLEDNLLKGTIRISLSKLNTIEDVFVIAKSLKKIIYE